MTKKEVKDYDISGDMNVEDLVEQMRESVHFTMTEVGVGGVRGER